MARYIPERMRNKNVDVPVELFGKYSVSYELVQDAVESFRPGTHPLDNRVEFGASVIQNVSSLKN